MKKKQPSIPINALNDEFSTGIVIGKILPENLHLFEEASHSHRHDYHIFMLFEKGSVQIEIDFEKYDIDAPAVLHVHPNQVHRILKTSKVSLYILGMQHESLNNNYLDYLEQSILSATVIPIHSETQPLFFQTAELCNAIFDNQSHKLYASLLRDYCNALVGLIISQYLEHHAPTSNFSRQEVIARNFKILLEQHFTELKRPADYAAALNLSIPYLNECVSNVSGSPVSYHIQQRIVLEAKRMLLHSDKSVKEIAIELGYEDYAYFSRLFKKIAGISALSFKNKNLD